MSKNTPAVAASQSTENPVVLIRYQPENAPIVLAQNVTKEIARIQSVKKIENLRQMESASGILSDANVTLGEVETFLESLRFAIQHATERVREIPGFEDFEATLTVRKWKLRSVLQTGIETIRSMRARFLSDEQEKQRKAQADAEAKQAQINKKAADDAAKTAKAQGASAETVREIKQEVLATPAPIVESKTLNAAAAAGTSVRLDYTCKITNLRQFLVFCLNSPPMFAELTNARPEIEKVFRSMARSQKDKFAYPGATFNATPIDTQRGR